MCTASAPNWPPFRIRVLLNDMPPHASVYVFSTRARKLKNLPYVDSLTLTRHVLWIDRRHNGLPQNILLVRMRVPGFSAHARSKKLLRGGRAYTGKGLRTHTKKGAYAPFLSNYIKKDNDYACSAERATLPDLRQRVQTFFLGERPFSKTVTRWIFGLNLRLTVRCEWLIERPATACLPQKSQTFDITTSKEARDIAHQFTCAVTMYHIKRSLQSQKGRIWWFGVRSALTALQNITLTLWPESSLRPPAPAHFICAPARPPHAQSREPPHERSHAYPPNIMSLGF